jgi:hypothetical protein
MCEVTGAYHKGSRTPHHVAPVVPPRPMIMPHGNCLAMPQVTAVDEQFGTHRLSFTPVWWVVGCYPRPSTSLASPHSMTQVVIDAPIANIAAWGRCPSS